MHPFSNPWKHEKALKVLQCFQEVKKGCILNKWVKHYWTQSTVNFIPSCRISECFKFNKNWKMKLDTQDKKMKFSVGDFWSKCDQVRGKLRIWSYLLKKFLMENFVQWRHKKQSLSRFFIDYVIFPWFFWVSGPSFIAIVYLLFCQA